MPDRKPPAAEYDHSPTSHSNYPPRHPPPPPLQHPADTSKSQGPPQPHPQSAAYSKHAAHSPRERPPNGYHHPHHPPYQPPHGHHPPPPLLGSRWIPEESRDYAGSPSTPTQPGSTVPSRRPSQQPPSHPSSAGPAPPNQYQGPSPPHQGAGVHESRPPPAPSPHHPSSHPMAAAHEYYGHHEPPGHHVNPHHYPPHHPPPPHIEYQSPQHPVPYDYPYSPHGHDPRNVPRRQVRATQACEECRKKKSKCDEARPQCNTCNTAGIECHYREVQPPKQERSIIQVLQAIDEVKAQQQDVQSRLRDLLTIVREHGSPSSTSTQTMMNGVTSTPVHAFQPFTQYNDQSSENGQNNTPSTTNEDVKPHLNGGTSHGHSADAPDIDILNGEQSMPKSHSTAAHKLVHHPFIKSFFSGVDPDYIKLDAYRGTINLYDRAHTFRRPEMDSNRLAASSPGAASAMSTSSDSGMGKPMYSRDLPPGGFELRPGQIPSLDHSRANNLVTIYMTKIHQMQPFVDVDKVKTHMKNHFILAHEGSSASRSGSPHSGSPYDAPPAKKRKGSDGNIHMPYSHAVSELRNPDRSIDTAVMLLVFALGEICDHSDDLSSPLEHSDEWLLVQRALAESESSAVSRPIGPHVPNAMRALSMNRLEQRKLTSHKLARTSSADGPTTPPNMSSIADPLMRNIDSVPGLCFYAYAVGILGEQLGGETLAHVQAALLAGLYMGQLARVHESYSWIHRAGTAMQGLLKRSRDAYVKDRPMGGHETQQQKTNEFTIRTYWACHQLESDILAELDNPSSGITSEEDKISILFTSRDSSEDEILQYYNSMIQVRKILNRTHSSLYVEPESMKLSKSGWTNLKAGELNRQLEQWRSLLPSHLQWKDDDPVLTTNTNDARLRGKYFGAKYIINRPYLLHKLYRRPDGGSEETENAVNAGSLLCIKAAQDSTLAFDGIHGEKRRLILTNVFGTAHAQFGNMLVLAAVMMDKEQAKFLHANDWHRLIDRTVRLFQRLAALSPALTGDMLILQDVQKRVKEHLDQQNGVPVKQPPSANSSFSEHHTYPSSAPAAAY